MYTVSDKVQRVTQKVVANEKVKKALAFIEQDSENTIKEQLELVVIQAPTGHELDRANYMVAKFKELGLKDCRVDSHVNAIGVRPGKGKGKILIEAHMDTVFPLGTVIEPKRENGIIYAPGIVDDTRGCVNILSVIRALNDANIETDADLVFAGTAREEGMGGLSGIKGILQDDATITGCVCVDGPFFQSITYEATGIKTYEANFYGIGGHAMGAFAKMANPLNAAARAVAKIADIQVPTDPKTIFCVSNFHAGNDAGIHAIVPKATIKYNIRSNSTEELEKLDKRIHAAIAEACFEETRRWGMDTITYDFKAYIDVPAGTQCQHAPIVEANYEFSKFLGAENPIFSKGGSTNANIPIGKGIPAVCVGSGDGSKDNKVHTEQERFYVEDAYKGVQLILLMTAATGGISGETQSVLEK